MPPEWCRVAELSTSRVTSAEARFAFYLVAPTLEARMRGSLAAFAPGLPLGSRLETRPCG